MNTMQRITFIVMNYEVDVIGDNLKAKFPVKRTAEVEKDLAFIKEHKSEIINYIKETKANKKAETEKIEQLRKQNSELLAKLAKNTNKNYAEAALRLIVQGTFPETAYANACIAYANYCDANM